MSHILITVSDAVQPSFLLGLIGHLRGVQKAEIVGGEALEQASRHVAEANSGAPDAQATRVIEAALLVALCPDANGFADGPGMFEATAELEASVSALVGIAKRPGTSLAEVDAALKGKRLPYSLKRHINALPRRPPARS